MPLPSTGQMQTCASKECKAAGGAELVNNSGVFIGALVIQIMWLTGTIPSALATSKAGNPLGTSSAIQNVPESYQIRAASTCDRMKIAAHQHNAGPGTTHTTNSLLSHEHGGGTWRIKVLRCMAGKHKSYSTLYTILYLRLLGPQQQESK